VFEFAFCENTVYVKRVCAIYNCNKSYWRS